MSETAPKPAAENNPNAGYHGIYLERFGENAKELITMLISPPEKPLPESEKQAAYAFEHDLSNLKLESGITIAELLTQSSDEDLVAPAVYTQPFLENKITSETIKIPHFETEEDVEFWAAETAANPNTDKAALRKLFNASTNSYKETIAAALTNNIDLPEETFHNMSIVLDPAAALARAKNLTATRIELREIRRDLSTKTTDLNAAEQAITEIYLSAINAQLANQIPVLEYLATQTSMIGDQQTTQAALDAIPPGIKKAIENGNIEKAFKRLDYLRNGVARNADGRTSGVSEKVITSVEAANSTAREVSAPKYTPEQIEQLKAATLTPDQIAYHAENILSAAGILSQHKTPAAEAVTRPGRAPDDLWQVIKNPGKSTFAVDSIRGLYKVSTQDRTVFDVIAVGFMHEFEHINQAQSDRQVSATLKIAGIKGKRVSGLRETGANIKQHEYMKELTGAQPPIALTYANALRAIEQTGQVFAAIKASYDTQLELFPNVSKQKAAIDATDRVLRLTRMGGLNSQPMVYAEKQLLAQEISDLPPVAKARATAITGLDLVDQVKLHKFDLLPNIANTAIDWKPLIEAEMDPIINQVINNEQR